MNYISTLAILTSLAATSTLAGAEYGGIEFPQGALSFADHVVSYDPAFSGGAVPTNPNHIDPLSALGVPDHSGGNLGPGSVSLGAGGRLVLEFTNNRLTGSGDADPDIHIFEIGTDVEDTFVDISADGITWHAIGKVFGSTSSIDIDAFGFGIEDEFAYVRLTDDKNEGNTTGSTVGADIDAVGAISTSAVQDTPELAIETAILVKFQSAVGSVYTIQESTDAENWEDSIPNIAGDGSVLKFFFEISTPHKFYRLRPSSE